MANRYIVVRSKHETFIYDTYNKAKVKDCYVDKILNYSININGEGWCIPYIEDKDQESPYDNPYKLAILSHIDTNDKEYLKLYDNLASKEQQIMDYAFYKEYISKEELYLITFQGFPKDYSLIINTINKEYINICIDQSIKEINLPNFQGILNIYIEDEFTKKTNFKIDKIIMPKGNLNLINNIENNFLIKFFIKDCECKTINLPYELDIQINNLILHHEQELKYTPKKLQINNLTYLGQNPIIIGPNYKQCIKNINDPNKMITSNQNNKNNVNVIKDKIFVITGALTLGERPFVKSLIEKCGGKVSSAISKKTDYLITDNLSTSNKSKEAIKNGIKIINSNDLEIWLKSAGVIQV